MRAIADHDLLSLNGNKRRCGVSCQRDTFSDMDADMAQIERIKIIFEVTILKVSGTYSIIKNLFPI